MKETFARCMYILYFRNEYEFPKSIKEASNNFMRINNYWLEHISDAQFPYADKQIEPPKEITVRYAKQFLNRNY